MLYLSLGSNQGDRMARLNSAIALIEERVGHITARSEIIETEPWGFESNGLFLNMALAVDTSLPAEEVLDITRQIERSLGRKAKSDAGTYTDRPIDIDLLIYDALVISTDRLTLPHPLMSKRRFVLEPLAQIAPDLMHPTLHKTISQLFNDQKND